MFFNNPYFYFFTIALQAICVIHSIKKGNQSRWIYIIIFLPVVGSIAYLFTEIFSRHDINNVKTGVNTMLRPGANIRKLEQRLKFSDTFNNRVALADALLASGFTDRAIALYEESLNGAFTENEHVMMQLILAYYAVGRYQEIVDMVKKLYRLPQFARSRAHMMYALALEKTGAIEKADAEFKSIKGKFSYYESRYEYGLFLARNNRMDDAREIFSGILDEASYLSSRERSQHRIWFQKTREAFRKLKDTVG